MNDFDRAGRHGIKLTLGVVLPWLFALLRQLRFARWPDSQSAPRPGEPDRRCDTLAELIDPEGSRAPWTAVIELFTEADADALDRGVEYVGRFRREVRHGPHGQDRYHFALALVFLTTVPEQTRQQDELPGHEGDVFIKVSPRVLALADESAVALVDLIEQNPSWRPLLAWISLMQDGQTPEVVARWRGLAEEEPDDTLRKTLGSLVLTFAGLTNSLPVWRKGLEGFAVKESIFLREVRMEERAENLLRVLRSRLPGVALGDLEERIQAQQNPDELGRWFDLALSATSLEDFRAAIGG